MSIKCDLTIDDVVFVPIRPTAKGLIGFANLTCQDIALNGVAVYTKPSGDGYRLVYPLNKSIPNETFYFCPLNREFGELLTRAVNEKLQRLNSKIVY